MKNIEKIKTLKDYQLAEVIVFLGMHVDNVQYITSASDNLDAADLCENEMSIIITWLNNEYDEEKGFAFLLSGTEYIKDLESYNYLEGTQEVIIKSDPDELDEEDEE